MVPCTGESPPWGNFPIFQFTTYQFPDLPINLPISQFTNLPIYQSTNLPSIFRLYREEAWPCILIKKNMTFDSSGDYPA
jgi:hypothetical protein